MECKGPSPCLTPPLLPNPSILVTFRCAPDLPPSSRLALSELAPGVMQSEIRAMTTECDRIGGINLAQGVCDTPVPTPVS